MRLCVRAAFNWVSKVNCVCISFTLLRSVRIGQQNSRHFFNQWEAKPKPIASRTNTFCRALHRLHVIALYSYWPIIALFRSVVIGRSNWLGFGFTTLNWKHLYNAYNEHLTDSLFCQSYGTDSYFLSNSSLFLFPLFSLFSLCKEKNDLLAPIFPCVALLVSMCSEC